MHQSVPFRFARRRRRRVRRTRLALTLHLTHSICNPMNPINESTDGNACLIDIWRTERSKSGGPGVDKVKFRSGRKLTPQIFLQGCSGRSRGCTSTASRSAFPEAWSTAGRRRRPINLGRGLGRVRLCRRVRLPARDHERRLYAGEPQKLRGAGCCIWETPRDGNPDPPSPSSPTARSSRSPSAISRSLAVRPWMKLSRGGELELRGQKRWSHAVARAAELLRARDLQADYVTLGGGNTEKLRSMPRRLLRRGKQPQRLFRRDPDVQEDSMTTSTFPESHVAPPRRGETGALDRHRELPGIRRPRLSPSLCPPSLSVSLPKSFRKETQRHGESPAKEGKVIPARRWKEGRRPPRDCPDWLHGNRAIFS